MVYEYRTELVIERPKNEITSPPFSLTAVERKYIGKTTVVMTKL
jgi:hypothetical protein